MCKKGLCNLFLLSLWLCLSGFANLASVEDDTLDSLLNQLTKDDVEEIFAETEWAGRVMANVEDCVNVREEASTESPVVGKMYKGDAGDIVEQSDGWTKIESGEVTGWVNNDYLAFGKDAKERAEEDVARMATVMTQTLNVRDEASTEAEIVDSIGMGEKVIVGEEQDGWYEIPHSNGEVDYISADYVEVAYEYGEAKTLEEVEAAEAAKRAEEEKANRTKNLGAVSASGDDVQLLAALIQAEGANQPYEGQVGIGAVVMNRVRSKAYPNTIRGVISQPGQFIPVGSGAVSSIMASGPLKSCVRAAQAAINGETTVGSMTHFKNAALPVSCQSIIIGNHVFY